jgi:hypothetical protein
MENVSSLSIFKFQELFPMVYWKTNFDYIYYFHFCPKDLKHFKTQILNVWDSLCLHSPNLWKCVLESWDILPTHYPCHELSPWSHHISTWEHPTSSIRKDTLLSLVRIDHTLKFNSWHQHSTSSLQSKY